MNVFEEDHLVPIAPVEHGLAFFDTLAGCLVHLDDAGYRSVPLSGLASPWCVPGQPVVLDLLHEGARLRIRRHRITRAGLPVEGESSFDAPDGSRPIAVFADPDGGVVIALADRGGERLLLHSRTGTLAATPATGTPRALLDDSALLSETGEGWSVHRPDGTTHSGRGRIVSVASSSALAREHRRDGPDVIRIVTTDRCRRLQPPEGWTVLSIAESDRGVVAVGLHPEFGQRLMRGRALRPQPGSIPATQLFPLGARDHPVLRSTGVASGSSWRSGARTFPGVAGPVAGLAVDTVLHPVPLLRIRRGDAARALVVSLHGGPDSHELDDLRYGGLYRRLADTADVVALNYPGSAGLGERFQRSAWRSWRSALETTAATIERCARELGSDGIHLFGVSFGAWLALQVPALLPGARSVTAASPILGLADHLRRHAAEDPSLEAWAAERFGPAFAEASLGDARAAACAIPVTVIAPDADEIVDPDGTARIVETATIAGLPWRRIRVPGAHYPRTAEHARVRWAAMAAALPS